MSEFPIAKVTGIAGLILAFAVPTGTPPSKTPQNVPKSRVEAVHAKALTPEDYYVPLDNWLKKKDSPLSGKDFYEIGQQYRLDPDLLIAISDAETNLGKTSQRGSQFNVGSVCSYDSTATTCHAGSYRQGIEMMAETLTNQALGGYSNIGQLSKSYNPSGRVYATGTNWPVNVLATLSELKGRPIDATFNFRR